MFPLQQKQVTRVIGAFLPGYQAPLCCIKPERDTRPQHSGCRHLREAFKPQSSCYPVNQTVSLEKEGCPKCHLVEATICSGHCTTKDPVAKIAFNIVYQRACTYLDLYYKKFELPDCAAGVDPVVSYPVALSCSCSRCSMDTSDCTFRSLPPNSCMDDKKTLDTSICGREGQHLDSSIGSEAPPFSHGVCDLPSPPEASAGIRAFGGGGWTFTRNTSHVSGTSPLLKSSAARQETSKMVANVTSMQMDLMGEY
ncbi:Gonadotropin subunit beta-2 [Liparis tanakae]|uniref:Gonadotropin subunit beta-2 n=1 Tax=Liparis tanakae TaxID=230148 RepID=A0A4Z2GBX4_9TELE|nr:Gonadotropin subunit beta-2 [Liparis tanakae]